MNILATAILVFSALNIAALYLHYWLLNRAFNRLHDQIKDEVANIFEATDKDGKTVFYAFASAIIEAASASLVGKLKSTFMGIESGSARNARSAIAAIGEDTSPPIVQALASAFPSLGKVLRRQPGMINILSSAVKGGGNGHSPTDESTKPKFKLGGP